MKMLLREALAPWAILFRISCFPGRGWMRGIGRGGRAGSSAPHTRWRTPGSANKGKSFTRLISRRLARSLSVYREEEYIAEYEMLRTP